MMVKIEKQHLTNAQKKDRACRQKTQFETLLVALKVSKKRQIRNNAKLSPYLCKYCGLWHLATRK